MHYAEELKSVESCGADWHHLDVMDGHYVPNLTFGPPLISAIKKVSKIPLDVHIMVSNPDVTAFDYIKAGADYLVFHIEIAIHCHRLIQAIKAAGCKAGVALNPGTPVEILEPILADLDLINVMSVNPGFGGQSFIDSCIPKISKLRQLIDRASLKGKTLIQVDGGINAETGKRVVDAGADVLVAGTYIYSAKDRQAAVKSLRF
ncbi:MAG: ribulose-phosphate 3-epimerase [Oligoflexales bacterium]|nr:ribulose-phosphate 3-epimerase [Oligoflexales bacterium]